MDSSRHKMSGIIEATYGVTPANPAFKVCRLTGTKLALTKGTMLTNEIRANRLIPGGGFRSGVRQTGGDITTEISYGSHDEYMQAALCGTWAAKFEPYVAATVSAAAADNSINDSANAFPAFEPGDVITIAGFTGTAGNNQTVRVVSRTAAKIMVEGGAALVNDAAGEPVTITSVTEKLDIGVTRRSFSFLRQFTDGGAGTKPYHLFVGQECNSLALTLGVENLIQIVYAFVGKNMVTPSETAPAGTTYVAAPTSYVMDSFSGKVLEGGVEIMTVTEVQLTLENGIAPRPTVGSDTVQLSASIGRANATGTLTGYAEDSSLVAKFAEGEVSSLQFAIGDKVGNRYVCKLPRIQYTGAQMDTQGQGPITVPAAFQVLTDDDATGAYFTIERTPALV